MHGHSLFGEPGSNCLIIGEIGQAHEGSLGTAHAFIDGIAAAGGDAVKFQTHIASAESTPAEPWRVKFSPQDDSRYDYWKRMEFSEDQWVGLRKHAETKGMRFISSPFSMEAISLLGRVGVSAWKIASGEVGSEQMLTAVADTGLPVIVSSGMSPIREIDAAVNMIRRRTDRVAVVQCTSAYPCPPERIGLNLIAELRERYSCAVGLSDHSGVIYPGLAAASLGADVIEVHVTLSREMFGPDVPASVTTTEFRQLVEGVRFIERAMEHPVDKDAMAQELSPLRDLFMKSIVLTEDLVTGTILDERHLTLKKPGTGLSGDRLKEVIGRRLRRSVQRDSLLRFDDLEGGGDAS